eukprot:m.708505 g.708505  ORF g.708505 m.708505 type:complete len:300 (-) comp58744_c0_seq7:341-1240(-)
MDLSPARWGGEEHVILVTGASGFVGSHVIQQLLALGFRVRATVRNAKDLPKTKFLTDLPTAKHPLELFSADLTTPGSFDEAVAGCTHVIHTAAVVALTVDDPQTQMIDVTINGVKNILSACHKAKKAGTFQRYIHTSSIAAIVDGDHRIADDQHVFTEADNNVSASVANDPYSRSKFLSEQVINEFVSALPEDEKFSHCFINPGAIYGPLLNATQISGSPQIIRDLMTGVFPLIPGFIFPSVDVRDVATAHIRAALDVSLSGRFICVERSYWLREMITMCKAAGFDKVTSSRRTACRAS